MGAIDFKHRVKASKDVVTKHLDDEMVILDLASESYFGLDDVGTVMWEQLTAAGSIEQAYRALLGQYDVEPETLRADLNTLLEQLLAQRLVELSET